MADDVAPPVDEPVETAEGPTQEEQDALLAVNGDIKGEVKPNPTIDEEPNEEADDSPSSPVEESPSEEGADDTGDDTGDSGAVDDEGEVVEAAEPTPSTEELTPEVDEAGVYEPVTATDPGEFQPGDYSFEIQTTDGKVHKISTPEDAEALAAQLDNNPELISASQFLALGRKTGAMEQGIANDRKAFDDSKAEFDKQTEAQATREQYLTQWQGEVNYLRQKGDLPAMEESLNNADWTDPKVAGEPGVKETLALLKWMQDENDKRMEAGLPPDLSVVSAFTARQLEEMKSEEKSISDKAKQTTRARGSMVGKRAPFQPDTSTEGTLVGPARGLDELATEAFYAQ